MKILRKIIKKRIAKKYLIDSPYGKNPSYWTCFYYKNIEIPTLFCLHKNLGVLEEDEINEVRAILDNYFKLYPFKKFTVIFDTKEKINDLNVLTPSINPVKKLYPDLRKKLDSFKMDMYPDYRPHIVTDLPIIKAPFHGYALMYGNKTIKTF